VNELLEANQSERLDIGAPKRQAGLISTWRPSEQSTGPRTPEERSAACRNALEHRQRSAEALLQLRSIRALMREMADESAFLSPWP
jgi:hypothetical protein